MDIIDCIRSRRSVRNYIKKSIDQSLIHKMIENAIWAPSGKNGQPWKFKVVTDKGMIEKISNLSIHSRWMRNAPCFIFVFLDKDRSYHYIKDVQSCGAVIQTLLLCAQAYGLGSCWVGEILSKSETVMDILGLSDHNIELMALVTVGYCESGAKASRRSVDEFIL